MGKRTFGCSDVQGRVATRILNVQVAASSNEGLDGSLVAVPSGIVQRRGAVLGLQVDICTARQELLEHLRQIDST